MIYIFCSLIAVFSVIGLVHTVAEFIKWFNRIPTIEDENMER